MEQTLSILQEITSRYQQDQKGNLIPILQDIQEKVGYFSREIITELSSLIHVPETEILGVITFYTQFKLNKPGKHIIKVCHGTACHINGAKRVQDSITDILGIDVNQTTSDGLFTLEEVACLGCCSLAPVMMIDQKAYGTLTDKKIKKIISEYREKKGETHE